MIQKWLLSGTRAVREADWAQDATSLSQISHRMMIGSTCSHYILKWDQKKIIKIHVYDVGANEQQTLLLRFFSPFISYEEKNKLMPHIGQLLTPYNSLILHFIFITGMHMSIVASSYRISVLG